MYTVTYLCPEHLDFGHVGQANTVAEAHQVAQRYVAEIADQIEWVLEGETIAWDGNFGTINLGVDIQLKVECLK